MFGRYRGFRLFWKEKECFAMKKLRSTNRLGTLLAGLVLLGPFTAICQTTNIIRVVEGDQLDLISVPLVIAPSNKFGLITSNATQGSLAYFYEPSISNFSTAAKGAKGWNAASSNRIVLPGRSFFLRSPPNAGHASSISGTIPVGPITNQIQERWSALGYPYPASVAWTDTTLSSNLPVGTLVYFWNPAIQQYRIIRKGPPAKGGWGTGSNHIVHPGDGFIVRQPLGSPSFEWTE